MVFFVDGSGSKATEGGLEGRRASWAVVSGNRQGRAGVVVVDKASTAYMGASDATAGAGELQALLERLLWIQEELAFTQQRRAFLVHADSQVARAVSKGEAVPKTHQCLARRDRDTCETPHNQDATVPKHWVKTPQG